MDRLTANDIEQKIEKYNLIGAIFMIAGYISPFVAFGLAHAGVGDITSLGIAFVVVVLCTAVSVKCSTICCDCDALHNLHRELCSHFEFRHDNVSIGLLKTIISHGLSYSQ